MTAAEMTHAEFSRKGGQSKSPRKITAIKRNLKRAWAAKKKK